MSHEETFSRAIVALNEFVFPRALREYQRRIAMEGGFTLPCPFSGQQREISACHVYNLGDPAHGNIGIAYRLTGGAPLWLLSGSVKDGFPLNEAYDPLTDQSVWQLADTHHLENTGWRVQLRELEVTEPSRLSDGLSDDTPGILIGHPNFAHHLWNELPALYVLKSHAWNGSVKPRIQAAYEPLAPLDQLVPGLWVDRIDTLEKFTGLQTGLVTRLGSTRLQQSAQRALLQSLSAPKSRAIAPALESSDPVIWISMRTDARTADNQEEFLLNLIERSAETYPGAAFVLDGFSYPADFGSPVYGHVEAEPRALGEDTADLSRGFLYNAMYTRESIITGEIARFRTLLAKLIPNAIINVSGLPLPEAISLAARADYYVCHTGTLQHKIAWFHAIPGFVHANRAGLQVEASFWLADQVEGAIEPTLLSVDLVEDLDSIRAPNLVERNRDYHFIDVDRAVGEVLADMRAVLAGRGGAA